MNNDPTRDFDDRGIPMAFSIEDAKKDPKLWALANRLDILLDSLIRTKVVAYNIPQGWIERIQTDAEDKPVVVDEKITIERLHGRVTVVERKL